MEGEVKGTLRMKLARRLASAGVKLEGKEKVTGESGRTQKWWVVEAGREREEREGSLVVR